MIYLKILKSYFDIFPKETYSGDFPNTVIEKEKEFEVKEISYDNLGDNPYVLSVVSDGNAFNTWYNNLSEEDKAKLEVLSEGRFYAYVDLYKQICVQNDSSKSNIEIVSEFISSL